MNSNFSLLLYLIKDFITLSFPLWNNTSPLVEPFPKALLFTAAIGIFKLMISQIMIELEDRCFD